MRQIKFRGLGLNKEWAVGNLCVQTISDYSHEAGSYISNSAGCPYAYQVRSETIGQFTGLYDKNGNEIYEGDILSTKADWLEATFVVTWNEARAQFKCEDKHFFIEVEAWKERSIIGNIYENPELLK